MERGSNTDTKARPTGAGSPRFAHHPCSIRVPSVTRYSWTGKKHERTHTDADEIATLAGAGTHVAYDRVGNMTTTPQPESWSSNYTLKYDAWNRLATVKCGYSPVLELSRLKCELGDYRSAEGFAERGLDIYGELGASADGYGFSAFHHQITYIRRAEGRRDAAAESAERAIKIVRSSDFSAEGLPPVLTTRAEIALDANDVVLARQCLEEAKQVLITAGYIDTDDYGRLLTVMGRLYVSSGETDKADECMSDGIRIYEDCGSTRSILHREALTQYESFLRDSRRDAEAGRISARRTAIFGKDASTR